MRDEITTGGWFVSAPRDGSEEGASIKERREREESEGRPADGGSTSLFA